MQIEQRAHSDAFECALQQLVAQGSGLEHIKATTRRFAIQSALAMSNNRVSIAAQLLKTTDRALQMELKKERSASRPNPREPGTDISRSPGLEFRGA
jgi:hypothetical protein